MTFFTDNVLSLGLPGATSTFTFTLSVTTDAPGDSFRARMIFGTGPLFLTGAVSRKTHGAAGTFDINLPIAGTPGVECRNSGGNHTLIFFFTNNIVSGSATFSAGTGSITGSPIFAGNTMTINLTGVTDAQTIMISLNNVTDEFSEVLPASSVSVGTLMAIVPITESLTLPTSRRPKVNPGKRLLRKFPVIS